MADDLQAVLNADMIDVLTGNPGLDLSLTSLARLRLEGGCVKALRYGDHSEDLDRVELDNGVVLHSSTTENLNRFRENFECAAKFGMRVTYCVTTDRKQISMVNLYPCRCSCDD